MAHKEDLKQSNTKKISQNNMQKKTYNYNKNYQKNRTVNTKAVKTGSDDKINRIFRYILIIALIVIVFYPPYLKGLYFENEQLPSMIFIFIVFIIYWGYKLYIKEKRLLETPIEYASLAFASVYFISMLAAVGLHLAIMEWLKYCMYFAVFLMITDVINLFESKIAILWTIIISATGVCFIGIDGAAGEHIVSVVNNIFKSLGLSIRFFDLVLANRISSTLQYPNTLAAYLMAVFFIALILVMNSDKVWQRMIAGAANFIILLTFIFTTSRGAYLIMPIAAVIFFLALPAGSRTKAAAYGLCNLAAAAPVAYKLYPYIMNPTGMGNGRKIWLLVMAGAVLYGILTVIISYVVKWLERVNWKIYAGIAALLAVVFTAAAIYVINTSVPLELAHTADQADSSVSAVKSLVLKPGEKYKLEYTVEASASKDRPNAYSIDVLSLTEKNIMFGGGIKLASYEGGQTRGIEMKGLTFKVPEGSRQVNIQFTNTYQGTSAKFHDAKIVDSAAGNTLKNIMLKSKYLPQTFASMFDSLQTDQSKVSRSIFYRDGFRIMKDHWLIGSGGGAWSLLYLSYQSYQYWSSQAHNYILQLGTDCGVLGLAVLAILLISILFLFITEYRIIREGDTKERIMQAGLFAAIVALFAHSVIDFDLSLSAVSLLLWELIAIFNSRYRTYVNPGVKVWRTRFVNTILAKIDDARKVRQLKISPVIGLVAAIVLLILPAMFQTATAYSNAAAKALENKNVSLATEELMNASFFDPFKPEYKIAYATMLISNKNVSQNDVYTANNLAEKAGKLGWYSHEISQKLTAYYYSTGNVEKGLQFIDRAASLRPLVPDAWQQRINAYSQAMMFYFSNKNNTEAFKLVDKILGIVREATDANKKNMNPFMLGAKETETLEKVKYIKDMSNTQKSINIDKIAFYSIPGMDVNLDGIPDQWTSVKQDGTPDQGADGKPGQIRFKCADDMMTAENIMPDADGFIRSRAINLLPDKKYTVSVELANPAGIGSIPYSITGLSSKTEELKPNGNVFTAEITTPTGFAPGNNFLTIIVKGRYEIKNISILEQ